jgi:hypothetical protein
MATATGTLMMRGGVHRRHGEHTSVTLAHLQQSLAASGLLLTLIVRSQKAMPTLALHPFPLPGHQTQRLPYTPSGQFALFLTGA